MIVAMPIVRAVQMPINDIVDVIAVRYTGVPAFAAMLVTTVVRAAAVIGCAGRAIGAIA